MALRFDRGTVVLDDPAASNVQRPASGLSWDRRVRRWRGSAHTAAGVLRELGGPVQCRAELSELIRDPAPLGRWDEIPLRWYQQAALGAWRKAGNRGVVVLPTGSGKTRLALAAMRLCDSPVLVVAPTRTLMQQWATEIAKFYRGRVGRFGDGERSLHAVTVATYASAWRHMTRLGGLFPLVVVDEAHHVGDGQLAEALEMALASDRLGLTATPNEGEIAERGRRLLGDVVFELQVRDLVGEALAHYDLVRVRVALDPQERLQYDAEVALFEPVYHRWRQGRRHARWRDFVMAAQRDPDSRAALAAWRRAQRLAAYPQAKAQAVGRLLERHAWDRCLVFTPDNAVTYAISRDHLVAPVTCDTSRRERKAVLEDFSAHRIASLVSARVLNEGLDLPDANVGVMVGGRGGKREFIQRLGRVLRPAPGKRARIYELLTAGSVDSWRKSRRGSP